MIIVSYTRSTSCRPEQSVSNDTIKEQNERISAYIKKKNWKLDKKYSDRKNDTQTEQAFLQMKQDGIGRKYDCVVMDSIFRCGQNVLSAYDLLSLVFLPAGIRFAVVEDDFYSGDYPESEVKHYLEEKRDTYRFERLTNAAIKSTTERRYPKYGYCYKDGEMELVPDEAVMANVQLIFQMAADGHTAKEILDYLIRKGIESPMAYQKRKEGKPMNGKASPWNIAKVRSILNNRLYLGEWRRVVFKEEVMQSCPPLIDEELFQKAHERMSERNVRKNKKAKKPVFNPFYKRIFDKETQHPLNNYQHPRLGIRIYRFGYPRPAGADYEKAWLPCEEVQDKVMECIHREQAAARKIRKMLGSQRAEMEKEQWKSRLRKKMWETVSRQMEIENRYVQCGITEMDTEKMDGFMEESRACEEELKSIMSELSEVDVVLSKKNPWIELFASVELKDGITADISRKLIEKIEVYRFETVEVTFCKNGYREMLPQEWFSEV